jgi:cytochrome c biogenesis protein CcmG, thiol:disulfide interchange protein DsbE
MILIERRALIANLVLAGMFGGLFDRATVGKPAPPFVLTTYDGHKVSLADLAGKVIVLNFWATWCAPCRVELPLLDAYIRVHSTPDLKLFAVATEDSVPPSQLKPLAAELSFPLALRISSGAYGPLNNSVPSNYVIDRAGIVRYAKAAAFDVNSFDSVVAPLLAEPAPGVATKA